MRTGIRTLMRTISALVIVLMLGAGASMEALAHGRHGKRNRQDNGRHLGWTRGRHRGWEHSRSRHVRDDDFFDSRRDRRRARRALRRDRRDDRRELRRFRRSQRAQFWRFDRF
jgi:hypothetical protein